MASPRPQFLCSRTGIEPANDDTHTAATISIDGLFHLSVDTIAMNWTIETVSAVDAKIEALPVALRARLIRLLGVVKNVGLETLRAPHVRHLEGKLWELRVRAEGGIARGIYVTAASRRVVVLHVFAKKSRRAPRRALATARERMRQVTPRRS